MGLLDGQFTDDNIVISKVEDLLNVQGIGPRTLEKNKDRIVVK